MRQLCCLCVFILLAGCKSNSAPTARPVAAVAAPESSVAAAALVFDPPIAMGEVPLDLDRDARAPVAFVGFDQLTTTFFYLRTDDKQRFDNFNAGDRYERRAVSERFGVSYR
jgi:hypothetical protein